MIRSRVFGVTVHVYSWLLTAIEATTIWSVFNTVISRLPFCKIQQIFAESEHTCGFMI